MKQTKRLAILAKFAQRKRGNKQLLFALLRGDNEQVASFSQQSLVEGQRLRQFNSQLLSTQQIDKLKELFPNNENIAQLFAQPAVCSIFQAMLGDIYNINNDECEYENESENNKDSAKIDLLEIDQEENIYIYGDENYPRQLEVQSSAPLALYTSGKAASICWQHPLCITIVGSRKATSYGMAVTADIVRACAQYHLPVLSGLAYGIDRQVHETALQFNLPTLAVLANGVDICYPRQNQPIYEKLFASGFLISEFPRGTRPRKEYFPARNRILSALAHAVVVVEAAAKSGSLITASHALHQGKDVYAVPGNIYVPTSQGTNQLIADGAQVYTDADRFLYSLEETLTRYGIVKSSPTITPKSGKALELSEQEIAILKTLLQSPHSVQELFREFNLSLNEILSTITLLETKELVQSFLGIYDLTQMGLREAQK